MIRVEMYSQNTATSKQSLVSNHSKMIETSIRQNERENQLLRQHKKELQNEHILARVLDKHEKIQLQKDLVTIPKVKKVAPISAERVLFLNQHGVKLNDKERFYNINYFMSLIDDVIESPEEAEKSSSGLESVNNIRPTNPSKFPLRLDFSNGPIIKSSDYQRNSSHTDGQTSYDKFVAKHNENIGKVPEKNIENVTNDRVNFNDEDTGSSTYETNVQHNEQKTEHSNTDKKSKQWDRNAEHTPNTDKKLAKQNSAIDRRNRPPWMFRTIDPPEHGRYIWKAKSKFGVKPDELEKQRIEEERREVSVKPPESKEDIALNEKVNDYRYRVLARNKMSSLFVPVPSAKVVIENISATKPKTNENEAKSVAENTSVG